MIGRKVGLFSKLPHPSKPGMMTVCPVLLMGKSSVMPCSRARKMVCPMFIIGYSLSLSMSQVFLFICLKFRTGISIDVVSVRFRQEKVITCRCRGCSRLKAGETRATDRRGREARMCVGVPGAGRYDQASAVI